MVIFPGAIVDLLRLLAQHPQVEIEVIASHGAARSFTIGDGGSWWY